LFHDRAANSGNFSREEHRPRSIAAQPDNSIRTKSSNNTERSEKAQRHAISSVDQTAYPASLQTFDRQCFQIESFLPQHAKFDSPLRSYEQNFVSLIPSLKFTRHRYTRKQMTAGSSTSE
jgi:hypothetical protein